MELVARPIHRYPLNNFNHFQRVEIKPTSNISNDYHKVRYLSKLNLNGSDLKLKKRLWCAADTEKSEKNFVAVYSVSKSDWDASDYPIYHSRALDPSSSDLILWDFPPDNLSLYGAFTWSTMVNCAITNTFPIRVKFRGCENNYAKDTIGINLLRHCSPVTQQEEIQPLTKLENFKHPDSFGFHDHPNLYFDVISFHGNYEGKTYLQRLHSLALKICSPIFYRLCMPVKIELNAEIEKSYSIEEDEIDPISAVIISKLLLSKIIAETLLEEPFDPYINLEDQSIAGDSDASRRLASLCLWSQNTLAKLTRCDTHLLRFPSSFKSIGDLGNLLLSGSHGSGKFILFSVKENRRGELQHNWYSFSQKKVKGLALTRISPVSPLNSSNDLLVPSIFQNFCNSRPSPLLPLIYLTANIHSDIAELTLQNQDSVAPKQIVPTIANTVVGVMPTGDTEDKPTYKEDRNKVAKKEFGIKSEANITRQVDNYFSKSLNPLTSHIEKESIGFSIMVSELFYESFPSVIAELQTKHQIRCIDFNVNGTITAILDPAVGVFIIGEEEILDRDKFRVKLQEIIKSSFQFYRLWVLILQRSVAHAFSNDRVLLLCQSFVKLPCKVCVHTCPYTDVAIVSMLSNFCMRTLQMAEEVFLKPEAYNDRQYLLNIANPQIAAQVCVLQKFPMVNAFVASVLLRDMKFADIVVAEPEKLKKSLSKYSIHAKEMEEILDSFHVALNQYLS